MKTLTRKNYQKERYKRRLDAGLCLDCPNTSKEDSIYCVPCLERKTEDQKERNLQQRRRVLMKYGGRCECCGEDDLDLLTIDHINNDGRKDRRGSGSHLYASLYKQLPNLEEGLRDLCWNCNAGSGNNHNVCPHKDPVDIDALIGNRKCHKQALMKYGGICVGCGETELGFLTLEHINGGGKKEIREKFDGQSDRLYRHLRDGPIRDDITVLCWNCNCF